MTSITIISGGQTGVDRAALDTAIQMRIAHGGWCPRGRRAEDGPLDPRYRLRETPAADYEQRTQWNVRDADGTLILKISALDGGTRLTCEYAAQMGRPFKVIDLESPVPADKCRRWITEHHIQILNIAGPRESKRPGIYNLAAAYLRTLLPTQAGPRK